MDKIQPGKYVELGYDLYAVNPEDKSEILVHQTNREDPEGIVFGVTQGMIEPLEHAIDGLKQGDRFNVTATAEEAFGPHDPEKVVELEKSIFLVDGHFDSDVIYPGASLPMMTAEGYHITGLVCGVTDTHVKMDFNHPLAGKDVRFDGEILLVRDATPEDIQPQSCGCGCHGGSCSDGCDDSCHDDSCCGCGH